MKTLRCQHLHQPGGWLSPGVLRVDPAGVITGVDAGAPGEAFDESLEGFVVPGVANLHSHAFQRGLAGFGQTAGPSDADSFWTWRTLMYRLALSLTPDDLRAVAAQLYVEMLEAGFTAVGEFQYLHHQPDGRPYDDPAEMSRALIEAATTARLPLTLLPVAYFQGGFDRPAEPHQRRFVFDGPDSFFETWQTLATAGVVLGVAPHSLRAVSPAALEAVVLGARSADAAAPIHIHIAEQPREVAECRRHRGARPVEWLLDHQPVDASWCLVHATHVSEEELAALTRRGPVVGLCPTTEADLGDGVFPAQPFVRGGGRWGVGSDAHVAVNAPLELATLEWGQRLVSGRRNVIAGPGEHGGRALFDAAAAGGAAALNQPAGALTAGRRADALVLDPKHPRLLGHEPSTALDAWIFSADTSPINEVWVAAERVVAEGRHVAREAVAVAFGQAMKRIAAALV